MRISNIDSVITSENTPSSGMRIEQRASVSSAIVFLLILLPAIAIALTPVVLLGGLAITDLGMRAALFEKAGSALMVVLGLSLWAALWSVPAWRFLRQLGAKRQVEIVDGRVGVTDRSLFGKRTWSCLLSEFNGISHNVRTTLSGFHHELVLVHDNASMNVLVHIAPKICEAETLRFSRYFRQQMVAGFETSIETETKTRKVASRSALELKPVAA